jgi:hypothetical protein
MEALFNNSGGKLLEKWKVEKFKPNFHILTFTDPKSFQEIVLQKFFVSRSRVCKLIVLAFLR